MRRLAALFEKMSLGKEERAEYIGLHSVRISWLFTTIVLLIWSFQGLISSGRLETQASVFFASQLVFWLTFLLYRKKSGG